MFQLSGLYWRQIEDGHRVLSRGSVFAGSMSLWLTRDLDESSHGRRLSAWVAGSELFIAGPRMRSCVSGNVHSSIKDPSWGACFCSLPTMWSPFSGPRLE